MELVYALQEDSRNDRYNGIGDIFGTTVRNKRHGVEDSSGQEYRMGGYTRWSEAYLRVRNIVWVVTQGGLRPTWSL